jgi:hypothetical protein
MKDGGVRCGGSDWEGDKTGGRMDCSGVINNFPTGQVYQLSLEMGSMHPRQVVSSHTTGVTGHKLYVINVAIALLHHAYPEWGV